MKHTRPANDRFLPFHIDSLFLTFVSTGSQKETLVEFPPIGKLRYKKGIFIMLQWRTSKKDPNTFLSTPITPIFLLKKFILSPEQISKHLRIPLIPLIFWILDLHMIKVSFAKGSNFTSIFFAPTFNSENTSFVALDLLNLIGLRPQL